MNNVWISILVVSYQRNVYYCINKWLLMNTCFNTLVLKSEENHYFKADWGLETVDNTSIIFILFLIMWISLISDIAVNLKAFWDSAPLWLYVELPVNHYSSSLSSSMCLQCLWVRKTLERCHRCICGRSAVWMWAAIRGRVAPSFRHITINPVSWWKLVLAPLPPWLCRRLILLSIIWNICLVLKRMWILS